MIYSSGRNRSRPGELQERATAQAYSGLWQRVEAGQRVLWGQVGGKIVFGVGLSRRVSVAGLHLPPSPAGGVLLRGALPESPSMCTRRAKRVRSWRPVHLRTSDSELRTFDLRIFMREPASSFVIGQLRRKYAGECCYLPPCGPDRRFCAAYQRPGYRFWMVQEIQLWPSVREESRPNCRFSD